MKKKALSLILSLTLILSMACTSVFADATTDKSYSFDNEEDYLNFSVVSGDKEDTNAVFRNDAVNKSYNSTKKRIFGYESAVFGRSSDDYSQVMRIHSDADDGINITTTNGNLVYTAFYDSSVNNQVSCNDGRYYEASLASAGDAKLAVQLNTGTYVLNDLSSWKENAWNRIGIWINNYTKDNKYSAVLYVNGVAEKTISVSVWRIRVRVEIPNGTKDAFAAIDDYKAVTGAESYTPSTAPEIYFNSSGVFFSSGSNTLYISGDMTVVDIKNAASTSAVEVYGDLTVPADAAGASKTLYTAKSDSDTVSIGDTIIVTDSSVTDFVSKRYITVQSADGLKSEYDFDSKDLSKVTLDGNATRSSDKAAGLYTKSADDNSLRITAEQPSGNTSDTAARLQFDRIDTNKLIGNVKSTVEFSVAGDGDYNYIEGHLAYQLNGKTNILDFLRVDNDGKVISSVGNNKGYKLAKQSWIRVAFTFDPSDLSYKTYVNGDLVSDGTIQKAEGDTFSFLRLSASVNRNAGGAAYLYLDDIKIYFGDYSYDGSVGSMIQADAKNAEIYAASSDYDEFMASVNPEGIGSKKLYTLSNGIYTEKTDSVSDGDVLVLQTADGLIKKYYTVKTSKFTLDPAISVTETDGKVTASINGKYFKTLDAADPSAVLILAIYSDNTLVSAVTDTKTLSSSGDVAFKAEFDGFESGMTAKAFLWDSLESLTPYGVTAGNYPAE